VFFLDGRREPSSTAADHVLPARGEEAMLRRLDGGREYRIVKNSWPAHELQRRFRVAGLDVTVRGEAGEDRAGDGGVDRVQAGAGGQGPVCRGHPSLLPRPSGDGIVLV
jgi:hypothetical protein